MTIRSESAANLTALSVLLMALILMGLAAAAPFLQLSALEDSIARHQETLSNLRREIAKEGDLRKENSDLATYSQDTDLLLKGETTGIAGANLQKLMSSLVTEHKGEASSFQILPPEDSGNLVRIPMSLSVSVSVDGLRDILYGLEAGTPLIFIDEIAIRSKQDDFRTPDPHYIGPFDVTLRLSGYMLKNGAP